MLAVRPPFRALFRRRREHGRGVGPFAPVPNPKPGRRAPVMVRPTRLRDERGAVLVLMSITLVMLLGFSALVIDLGAARAEKRQLANTADASALGGAQDLPLVTPAANQVKTLAEENYGILPSAWADCTDPSPLAMQGNDGTDCISYDTSFTHMRVVLPTQQYQTTFARILGRDELPINAAAEARRVTAGLGAVQPYGLYGLAGGGNGEVCLVTGEGGHAAATPPCDGPATGNFGALDVRQYGNPALLTAQRCGNGQNNERLANNVAIGIDHLLSVYTGTEVVDFCAPGTPYPNTVEVKTGNAAAFDDGIRKATSGLDDRRPAKLQRIPGGWTGWPTRPVAARTLDNKPLWDFIGDEDDLSDVPDSCQREVFEDALTDDDPNNQAQLHALIQTCFSDYNLSIVHPVAECSGQCTGDLFTRNSRTEKPIDLYDIQDSTRFVYVPRFVEVAPPPGVSVRVHIAGFKAVFLQRLFGGCNAKSCDVDFEPGVGTSSMGALNDKTDAITGFVFNAEMLPGTLGTNPFALGETQYIQLVR